MKQAKHPKGLHGHPACGNCARTIQLRHDAGKVACTAHLTVMDADRNAECAEYEAIAVSLPAREKARGEPAETVGR